MKRKIELDDHDIIVESLRDFRMYTTGMFIKPEEPFFSKELESQLVEFYRTEDPTIEAAYKKMIGVAVIKTCTTVQIFLQNIKITFHNGWWKKFFNVWKLLKKHTTTCVLMEDMLVWLLEQRVQC